MPKVVVYIPAADWRRLGEDPAAAVRQVVKEHIGEAFDAAVTERGSNAAAAPGDGRQSAVPPSAKSQEESGLARPRSVTARTEMCPHRVPPGSFCKRCD